MSLADISESLSPKSTVTVAGGYAFTHYYGTDTAGDSFIGSSQVSVQVGYNRLLTPKTQIALVYGYQGFDFSVQGTAFHTHVIQGIYGHRITGRLDFLVGAGPQITFIDTQTATCSLTIVDPYYCQVFGGTLIPTTQKSTNLGVSAQARLRYKFTKASVYLDFKRYDTNGSGFFAGAQSNILNLGGERPLSRVWDAFVNIGYSTNARLQPLSQLQLVQCGNPRRRKQHVPPITQVLTTTVLPGRGCTVRSDESGTVISATSSTGWRLPIRSVELGPATAFRTRAW